jgi:hypothetical protein
MSRSSSQRVPPDAALDDDACIDAMIPQLEKIKMLLWAEWDPIGCGVPKDEYDRYAVEVWRALQRNAGIDEIEAYLKWTESNQMGLSVSCGRNRSIAEKIVALGAP